MVDHPRARKIADRIKEVVAQMLDSRVKDPRLGFVTVTDVRVTGDLQHASIFYTVLGDAEARAGSAAALESAKGLIRSEVGKQLSIRLTPTLEFVADAVPENAQHLEEVLRAAAARDAELAALAASAQYAGDQDPYRHDDEPAGEDDDRARES
ncbi:30S ribosome-binding factor RbfA [Cellulomonas bogoriensis]|uniref:Ribosome-binding factor A n=1 Tax=Cellulomonas bogoriensis 69B4 = DSM 16987 TaxID=1386082 RepID=A0A0A0BZ39_9CELL|nr:30S ribosome-binding factor RbfA [Cellulomonas bogoriensis]KGM13200.1 ribosome-binding factor A [Cellulomonas bogoriensis 69B4 = DSM 16987]